MLEVVSYYIDSQTTPNAMLAVTYARVDPDNGFKKGGPFTQHQIMGLELIEVLAVEGGMTIEAIEASTLRTGIPMAYIRPEDLAPYESGPGWSERFTAIIKAQLEAQKKMNEQAMMPGMPGPGMPPIMQPPIGEQPT